MLAGAERGVNRRCITFFVELRRREVFATAERQLAVATEGAGNVRQFINMLLDGGWQPTRVFLYHCADVVKSWNFNTRESEQRLQGNLYDLLRFPHHIRPAFQISKHSHCYESVRSASEVVQHQRVIPHGRHAPLSPSTDARGHTVFGVDHRQLPLESR